MIISGLDLLPDQMYLDNMMTAKTRQLDQAKVERIIQQQAAQTASLEVVIAQ